MSVSEKVENKVETQEIEKAAETYRQLKPANRHIAISVAGLLLASQEGEQEVV